MSTLYKQFLTFVLIATSVIATAETTNTVNEETQAFQHCYRYVEAIKKSFPHEAIIDCKLMNYSAEEWLCMENERFKIGKTREEAMRKCYKSAPAIVLLREEHFSIPPMKSSTACITAFSSFAKFYPGDDRLSLLSKECNKTAKSALEWLCMNKFAEAGNSYNYAAGQCFPRKIKAS